MDLYETARLFYNPEDVSITYDFKIKFKKFLDLYPIEKRESKELTEEQHKLKHIEALVNASLQFNFWYGTSNIRLPYKDKKVDSSLICEIVAESFEDVKLYELSKVQFRLYHKLLDLNIKHIDKRLDILDELFDFDLEFYGSLYNNLEKSFKFINKISSFNRDIFKKKALFGILYSCNLRGVRYPNMPIPVDYHIPNILKNSGVLNFSNSINHKIQTDYIFQENSREELSIRSATLLAVKELAQDNNTTPFDIDRILFSNKHLFIQKHHLCDTINY